MGIGEVRLDGVTVVDGDGVRLDEILSSTTMGDQGRGRLG